MPADAEVREQIERTIANCFVGLDVMFADLSRRDALLHVYPASLYLAAAAASQIAKRSAEEHHARLVAGLALAEEVLGKRSQASRYGKGRHIAPITVEMAQGACEAAKKEYEKTNLVVDRSAAREVLLLRSLWDYCVFVKILEPANLGTMMTFGYGRVMDVIASGWLDRNTIKIRG